MASLRLETNTSIGPLPDPGSPLRVPWLLLLLGLIGGCVYAGLYNRAFQSAALDLKLDRNTAETRAVAFLEELGHDVRAYRRATVFWTNRDALIYLEKTLGTEETNRWLRDGDLHVWAWCTRFFIPLHAEEYSVYWSPRGELLGFDYHVPDDKALPSLASEEARQQADGALARWFQQFDERVRFVGGSEEARPHRIDRSYRWRVAGSPAALAHDVTITFSGSTLTSLTSSLSTPESFDRSETSIGSNRALLQGVFNSLDALVALVVCVFAFLAWQRRWLRWKPALGIAALLLVVEILSELNQLPLAWGSYETKDPLSAFWIANLHPLLDLSIGALFAALIFVSADAVGRLLPRSSYSLGDVPRRAFQGTSTFRTATLAGVGVAGIQLGFVVLFHVLGGRVPGFYSPIDVPYSNQLSTSIPWIEALLLGLSAAFTEEALYRLFAIPLLLLWLKRTWLAVLIPAVLWAFLHSSYYVEPIYARGIELTIVGVFLGLVFLRYGIWATIVSHCMYNATVCSMLSLVSGTPYLIASAVAVILAILAPLLTGRSRQSFGFSRLTLPARAAKPAAREPQAERRRARPQIALSVGLPATLAVVFLALALLVPAGWWIPSQGLDAWGAKEAARREIEQLGYSIDGYLGTADLQAEEASADVENYLRGHLSRKEWRAYLDRFTARRAEWLVRFVAPGRAQEYSVGLRPDGGLSWLDCSEADTASLATLSAEASRQRAEEFLGARKLDVAGLKYAGLQQTGLTGRKDVRHTWIDSTASVGDLRRKLTVDLTGERISGFGMYIEVPETFLRREQSASVWAEVQQGLEAALGAVILLLLLRALFDGRALRPLFSRGALVLGAASGTADVLRSLNYWPQIWFSYNSAEAVPVFVAKEMLELGGAALESFLTGYFVALLFLRLAPRLLTGAPTSGEFRKWLRTPSWRWHGSRAAFVWALAVTLAGVAIDRVLGWATGAYVSDPLSTELAAFGRVFPPMVTWLRLPEELTTFVMLGALIAASMTYFSRWMMFVLGGLFVASTITVDAARPWHALASGFSSILVWVVAISVVRFRLPFYGWLVLLKCSAGMAPWLLSGPGPVRSIAALALAPLGILVVLTFMRIRRGRGATGQAIENLEQAA